MAGEGKRKEQNGEQREEQSGKQQEEQNGKQQEEQQEEQNGKQQEEQQEEQNGKQQEEQREKRYGKQRAKRRRETAIQKELAVVEKQEEKLRQAAGREGSRPLGTLTEKIPPKVAVNLEKAFCKAFSIVFDKGTAVIEKSYRKEEIREDYMVRDYAVQVKRGRKELRGIESGARGAELRNMALTTAEGIGLGIFGIGLPDIVVFTGVLLKGIYETALHYGFSYDTEEERFLILKMMETALSRKEAWEEANQTVDEWLQNGIPLPDRNEMAEQMQKTAQAFAMDMLALKFLQGIPVAGILGGAGNPVYYRKVIKYVQLKYRKRYLNFIKSLP